MNSNFSAINKINILYQRSLNLLRMAHNSSPHTTRGKTRSQTNLIAEPGLEIERIQSYYKGIIQAEVQKSTLLRETADLLPSINWQVLRQLHDRKSAEIPSWIDGPFVENLLSFLENGERINIRHKNVTHGSNIGDNFASEIFRLKTLYTKGTSKSQLEKTIILKVLLPLTNVLFSKELFMYTTVIPEMHRLLANIRDTTIFGPRLLYHASDPYMFLGFEDIKKDGYIMTYQMMNLATAKIAFTKLAKWHACSVVAAKRVPAIKSLGKNFADMANGGNHKTYHATIYYLAQVVQTWENCKDYGEKIFDIATPIFPKLNEIFDPTKSVFPMNVLNHGDYHNRNMLFKKVEEITKDILFYDYQLCTWGSPAIDIIYVLMNSCSLETRNNHREELIKWYHDELVSTLAKLDYKRNVPSLVRLRMEIVRCGHFETFLACIFLPFMMSSFEEVILIGGDTPANLTKDPERMRAVRYYVFHKQDCYNELRRYFPILLKQGLLDL